MESDWLILLPTKGAENDGWCAFISNTQQYIQLDFTRNTRVTRIVTYGRSQKAHWVKRYMIQFSSDEEMWHNYTENGFVKVPNQTDRLVLSNVNKKVRSSG